jgi:starch synthase
VARVSIVTSEYPPAVLGGVGIHVESLCRSLGAAHDVEVLLLDHIFEHAVHPLPMPTPAGIPVRRIASNRGLYGSGPNADVLRAVSANLHAASLLGGQEIVHTHGWSSNFSGILAQAMLQIPHVVTLHSIEPMRPWRRERLGGGYDMSLLIEHLAVSRASAVIAVSASMASDVKRWYPDVDPRRVWVIPNGVDESRFWRDSQTHHLEGVAFDWDRSFVLFVGRVSRQKGLDHLLRAMRHLPRQLALVIRASRSGSQQLWEEWTAAADGLRASGYDVVWIDGMQPPEFMRQLYSRAAVVCSPSMYEPFGMVNLEALACGTPVVASSVGNIPTIVVDGSTGILVDVDPAACLAGGEEADRFSSALAEALGRLLADRAMAQRMGDVGRRRALRMFGWGKVAASTSYVYESLAGR